MLEMSIAVLLYLGWCVVNALIAAEKNRSAGLVFVLSLIGSPLLLWLYLVAVPVAAAKPVHSHQADAPPARPLRLRFLRAPHQPVHVLHRAPFVRL